MVKELVCVFCVLQPGKTSKDTVKDSDSPGDGLQDGIRVSRLTDRGPAARAGMLCGDYILQVSQHSLMSSVVML